MNGNEEKEFENNSNSYYHFFDIGRRNWFFFFQKGKVRKSSRILRMKKPDPSICEKPDGIDISHHNQSYDWSKITAKFCYIRATMGADVKDRRYLEHLDSAIKYDVPVGAYHFLTAKTDAKTQFDNFKSVAKKTHIVLRPMLDVEESSYWNAPNNFSDIDAHIFIREWCNLCKKHYGVSPIIYTTEKLFERYKLDKDFEDCLWWIANYNGIADYEKKCKVPFTIHQYSDKKYVEGFYGYVDCDSFAKGKTVNYLMITRN